METETAIRNLKEICGDYSPWDIYKRKMKYRVSQITKVSLDKQ